MEINQTSIETVILSEIKHKQQSQQDNYLDIEKNEKSSSSKVDNQRNEIEQNTNEYRFQLVPDHHYSHQIGQYQSYYNGEEGQIYSRKLQGAYILQNVMSRMTATLFISCWESLKALLSQQIALYHRLDEDILHQQIKEPFQSKELVQQLNQQSNQNNPQVNILSQTSKSIEQIKIQISQRQKRGFTLDSLEKIKQARSKSKEIKQIKPQRDNNNNLNKQSENSQINKVTMNIDKGQQQQQHTQIINEKEYEAQISQQDDKNQNFLHRNHDNTINAKQINQNQQQKGQYQQKHSLKYQGSYHKLLKDTKFTQHDFSHQSFGSANSSSYPYNPFSVPFSYKDQSHLHSHVNNFMQQNKSVNYIQTHKASEKIDINYSKQEIQRVLLLAEIADRLQFSKLRMEKRQTKNGYDFQIIRKITRLQKAINDIKQQDSLKNKQTKSTNYQQTFLEKNINFQTSKRQQQNFALKKLLKQIQLIRSDIHQIKSLSRTKQQENPSKIVKNENNFIFGIKDDRITHNENQTKIKFMDTTTEMVIPPKKIEEPSKVYYKIEPKLDNSNLSLSNKVYRKVHASENSQILQLQERQIREQYVRMMVQNVKKRRYQNLKTYQSDMDKARPIRGNYENEWKKLEQQRRHLRDEEDNCCVLIDYY